LKNALETAKEEGKVEGRIEGRTEGRVEGKVEGRDERNTEIAMEMMKNGETDEKVALYTGLSKETIRELRKRI
ncbi:MAG: hypothetical protein ACOCW1_05150, partial [Chitinispirillaceae bacterium]